MDEARRGAKHTMFFRFPVVSASGVLNLQFLDEEYAWMILHNMSSGQKKAYLYFGNVDKKSLFASTNAYFHELCPI